MIHINAHSLLYYCVALLIDVAITDSNIKGVSSTWHMPTVIFHTHVPIYVKLSRLLGTLVVYSASTRHLQLFYFILIIHCGQL